MIQKQIIKAAKRKAMSIDSGKVRQKTVEIVKPKFGKIEGFEDLKSRLLTALFYVGTAWAGWKFLIHPAWQKHQLKKANEKVLSDPNVQLASLLRQALIGAGTNEKLVMSVAQKIKDYSAVQIAYKKLTGNNLNQDLYKDLSSTEYKQFMDIVSHSVKAVKSTTKQGYIVVSTKDIRLRTTPDSNKKSYSLNSNILDTIPAGKLLGFATGKYHVDSNGVMYYQVRIKYLEAIPEYHKETADELDSKILSYWVGVGAINMFREFSQMRAAYPGVKIYKGTKDTGLRQVLK